MRDRAPDHDGRERPQERRADHQQQLAADIANIWYFWALWAFIGDKSVQNIGGGTLTDGAPAAASNGLPQHWIGQIWLKQ